MMDYFDFNMQMPDQWSDTDSEKTLVVHTPVRKFSYFPFRTEANDACYIGRPTRKAGIRRV